MTNINSTNVKSKISENERITSREILIRVVKNRSGGRGEIKALFDLSNQKISEKNIYTIKPVVISNSNIAN
jgi:hypothetical protein